MLVFTELLLSLLATHSSKVTTNMVCSVFKLMRSFITADAITLIIDVRMLSRLSVWGSLFAWWSVFRCMKPFVNIRLNLIC